MRMVAVTDPLDVRSLALSHRVAGRFTQNE